MADNKNITNVIRLLKQKKIAHKVHTYAHSGEAVDGVTVAAMTGLAPECVFKTLVTRGVSGAVYVFEVPVARELDLKKAAKAAREKSLAMLRADELLSVTGYVRGGCSPIGMKKSFPTFIDISAQELESMVISAGKIGMQAELLPADLAALVRAQFADICTEV